MTIGASEGLVCTDPVPRCRCLGLSSGRRRSAARPDLGTFLRRVPSPLRLAQDAQEDDVEDLPRLDIRRRRLAVEEVRDHDPVEDVADDGRDPLDRHLAHPPRRHQVAVELLPLLDVDLAVLEVRRPLAVLEVRALLDQQLDERRMVGEELEERRDRPLDPLQTILDPRDVRGHLLLELSHHSVRRRQEQRPLAGEMSVDRPLPHPQPFRQRLRDRVGEPFLGKQGRRRLQDLLATRQVRFL